MTTTYQRFVKRWEEVTELPPQTMGPLTPFYKGVVRRIKVMPWPVILFISLLLVVCVFLASDYTVTGAATILQRGF